MSTAEKRKLFQSLGRISSYLNKEFFRGISCATVGFMTLSTKVKKERACIDDLDPELKKKILREEFGILSDYLRCKIDNQSV